MDTITRLHEKLLAMNEALLLGSMRQNELAQAAENLNEQLRAEIAGHQRTEHALRQRTAQFESLLNEAPFGVYLVDGDFRICQMNPTALPTFNSIPGVIGRHFEEVVHILWPDAYANEIVKRFRHTLASGEPYIVIDRLERREDLGVMQSYEWQINRIPLPDGRNGVVCYFRDISERKRFEAELKEALAVAEKANQAKSEFLSHMSHELRTPLNAVLGFAQLLESSAAPLSLSQKRSVEQIVKAGWYLLDLINEILDLALIESGKLALCNESVSLADVMRECAGLIEPQAQARDIRVTFPVVDGACFIQADHTRVKQVIVNLLSNAIKYNRAGGTVAVEYRTDAAGRVRLSFADTGAGLAPEQLEQLFQPFNRLGQEQSAEEGTGIGLVLSKRLVELMGGVIGVDSTVDKGSVFWIELKLTPGAQTATGTTARLTVAPAQPQPDAPLRTVLYVEDNPANLMLVEEIIARRPDIHLLRAMDGHRGIAIARASRPDVILMDINLPGINGIRALEILAADIATAHIPVIAISAKAMPRDIDSGLTAGFFRYLTKPVNVTAFMDALDAAFNYATTYATRVKMKD
jgi:PAS domain S-box-containing protein